MTPQISPVVGAKYRLDNDDYVITSTHDNQVALCSLSKNTRRYLSQPEFAVFQSQGIIVKTSDSLAERSNATRLITSENDRKKYDTRRLYVDRYLEIRELGGCCKESLRQLIAEIAESLGDLHPPSLTTLYGWTARYIQSNRNPLSLLPRYPKHRRRRTQNTVIQLIRHYIKTVYLTSERPTITNTYKLFKGELNAENLKRARADLPLLHTPSYSTFWREVMNTDCYKVVRAREGSIAAQQICKHGRSLHISNDLYGFVQFDSHTMDIMVVDEQSQLISRPVLVAGINPVTRECVGWHISLGATCAEKFICALKSTILGNEADTSSGGKIREAVTDNGTEFFNDWTQSIAGKLGISLRCNPPKQPNTNSFIERFFGTVNSGLVHMLPGTTKGSVQALGDYDSKRHACLTLDDIREAFRKWLVIYHNTFHGELFTSPHEKRLELQKKCLPPERYTEEDLNQICLSIEYRRIKNGRVTISHLHWTGAGLCEIERKLGRKQKALVYYDPCNLAQVWVAHPSSPWECHPAHACNPNYQDELTFSEHQAVKEKIANSKKHFDHSLALQLLWELREQIEEIKQRSKSTASQQQTTARKERRSRGKYVHATQVSLPPRNAPHALLINDETTTIPVFETFNIGGTDDAD
ncbi:hypothetical protein ACAW63_14010 [Pseudomonas sp. QE6]|uniref:hypothetical protein n=1 Tax=Pseudomonas sp. QE6 TaxID=3242491 RepID=UPI003528E1CB